MGSTVTKGLQTLERLGSEVSNYDYTAIEFGGNDCDFVSSEVADSPDSPHLCKTPLEKFRVVYEEIVRKVRALGSKPVIVSLPPIDSSKFYKWIIRGLNEANISAFLGDKERLGRWQQYYNLAVSQIARVMKVPYIDITSPFLKTRTLIRSRAERDPPQRVGSQADIQLNQGKYHTADRMIVNTRSSTLRVSLLFTSEIILSAISCVSNMPYTDLAASAEHCRRCAAFQKLCLSDARFRSEVYCTQARNR